MASGAEAKFSITLMMDKDKSKVLFTSVDSTFADVILSFLTLPLGHILKLLENHYGDEAPTMGSLKSLYNGLQNLDSVYFASKACKPMLLNPRSSLPEDESGRLKLDICNPEPTKFFSCVCSGGTFMVGLYHEGAICSNCEDIMDTEIKIRKPCSQESQAGDEVFTKQTVSFLISDDMRMVPNVTGSLIQNLKKLGITDMQGAEMQNTETVLGLKEIMDLLKGLVFSRAPLTDLFLHNGQIVHESATTNLELLSSTPQLKKEENCSSSKKIKIKVMVQKSSNKFLFAQAESDFVEFLFCLLTIPLGQVEQLFNGFSCLGSVDNLYRSVADFNGEKCLVSQDTKDNLLKPKLPHKYRSNKQILSIEEQSKPGLYCHKSKKSRSVYYEWSRSNYSPCFNVFEASFEDPKGQLGSYFKRDGMFMVADDLTVTPLFRHTSFSTLMELEVPLADIQEVEIDIGLEERSLWRYLESHPPFGLLEFDGTDSNILSIKDETDVTCLQQNSKSYKRTECLGEKKLRSR